MFSFSLLSFSIFSSFPLRPDIFMLRDSLLSCRKDVKSQVECSITLPRQHFVFVRRMSGEGKIPECLSRPGTTLDSTSTRGDLALLLKDTNNFSPDLFFFFENMFFLI